ncbi:mannose-P-dolichol utilization defect 1 protein-like [Denticeps clupeoides]|uniref:Mannose-P-dolichol utilization defect 1 protein homolog n=1 Tax=Denticeps clupeoides TaxID=299321 RepID=A0AAY4EER2_9TELE|nr:mannose-P-dolichol utilization defect 1 protein-like [Denticeps clupeoides]XP_028838295.1 mannose-P-dolichol utilization defect 1 protein-like [Denticeps clupeoides]
MAAARDFLLTFFMPEKCYDQFFVHLNPAHVPCLKIVLNRTVGLWIFLGTVVAPLPQIARLLRGRSARGLSLTSALLQLLAGSGCVLYCTAHRFPVGAWGDRLFVLVQAALLVFLTLHYGGKTTKGLLFLVVYGILMYVLTLRVAPKSAVLLVWEFEVLVIMASRLVQAGSNYWRGSTGQLSAVSVFLVFTGSLARVYTSFQESGQTFATLTHALASASCGLVAAQVLLYRNTSPAGKPKTQ